MTKLGRFYEHIAELTWLMALAAAPMYFNIFSSRVFEPDKATFVRCLALICGVSFCLLQIERLAHPAPPANLPSRGIPRLLLVTALFFAAIQVLATITSVAPGVSWWGSYMRLQGAYTFLSYFTIFLIMLALLRRQEQVDRVINLALLVSTPIALYGILQSQRMDPLPWGGDVTTRVTSSLGNAIFLAAYLIMVVPLALIRWVDAWRRWRAKSDDRLRVDDSGSMPLVAQRIGLLVAMNLLPMAMVIVSVRSNNLWWMAIPAIASFVILTLPFASGRAPALTSLLAYSGILVAQVIAIVLTQSRGPWIGLVAGIICFAVLLALRWHRRKLLRNSLAVAIPLAIVLIIFNLPIAALKPVRDLPYIGRLGTLSEIDAGTGRVRWLIWQGSVELLRTRPDPGLEPDQLAWARPLLGYGPDAMSLVVNKVYQPGLGQLEARNASPDRNHLNLLDHLVMTGVLGLAAYVALIVAVLRQGWLALWKADSPVSQLIVAGLIAGLVSHLIESQVGIVIVATWTYFWVYLAILGGTEFWMSAAGARDPATAAPPISATSVLVSSTGASRRRRERRRIDLPVPATASPAASYTRWLWLLGFMLLCWVASVAISGGPPFDDAPVALHLSLALAVIGILAGAAFMQSQVTEREALRAWSGPVLSIPAMVIGLGAIAIVSTITMDGVAADVYYKRGAGAEQATQWPAAIQYYQRALRLQPDQDWYHIFFGRALLGLAEQRPAPAPGATPAKLNVAQLIGMEPAKVAGLGKLDALESARVIFERARSISPLNPDHYANTGRLERYWAQTIDPSRLDYAILAFEQAVAISPRTAHLQNELARTYLVRGEIDRAVEVAQTSSLLDPGFATTQALLGDIYQAQKRWDDALAAHGRAMLLDPGSLADQDAERRIMAYVEAGKIGPLVDACAQAVDRFPRNAAMRSTYAYVLTKAGRAQDALVQYQANLSIAPNDWVAHRNVAVTYQVMGRIPEAITATQSAIQYAPEAQRKSLQDYLAQLQAIRKP